MKYENKYYYINSHVDLENWARGVLEAQGAVVLTKIISALTAVYYPRDNMIRRRPEIIKQYYEIDKKRVEKEIPRLSLERLIADLLDENFRTTWICNDPACLMNRLTCEVVIAPDVTYELSYEDMLDDCKGMDMIPRIQPSEGCKFVVVPKYLNADDHPWFKKILLQTADKNLYLIREDKFHQIAQEEQRLKPVSYTTRPTRSEPQRKPFNPYWVSRLKPLNDYNLSEYIIFDTEHKVFNDERLLTEFGLLHIKNGKVVDSFRTMVDTKGNDPRIQPKYRDKSDAEIEDALPVRDLKKIFMSKVKNLPLVGYGVRMDLELLGKTFDEPISGEYMDLIWMVKQYLGDDLENYRMDTILQTVGLEKQKHYALDDCYSAYDLYRELLKRANA